MSKLRLALIREEKKPIETRVAFSPVQCQWLMNKYPGLDIVVQSSEHRCFSDEDYSREEIEVREDVSDADLLIGIKEVPKDKLLADKKYIFFSHTIKRQAHNKAMLQEILRKKVTLYDYECLVWENGERILGFGHFAGVVGAHNGFLAYGKRTGIYHLKRGFQCINYQELVEEYRSVKLPPMKIAVTGTGRVAKGVYELLEKLNLRMTSVQNFLTKEFDEPVYAVLNTSQLYERKDGKPFIREHFHQHPEEYESAFFPFVRVTDLFINAIYWNPLAPVFFTREDMRKNEFRIKVIADITCDVNGSVPSTIRESSIADPVYGYNPKTEREEAPYQPHVIDVMAVSNLPNELPRESSEEFGDKLIEYVVEELLQPGSEIMDRACIARGGSLTPRFSYLNDFVSQ
ncbi:MAG: alanine dehydrogenase [Chloroflexi bacterium]|nr:alanine dehydrogenase [Chloroflexota bacterium]